MSTAKLKRALGSRLFWLGFGLLLGLPQLADGLRYGLNGELFFGVGMLLLGVRGFLRPVVPGRALRMKADSQADTIGSPMLIGALSLAMAAFLVTGLILKFLSQN
ncbi:hypothetical protein [Massilia sp. ST3]|uniref:hypothetical protein n=1 Tax=Massilia sp. ST3 TaxID=2824903 RepID=UPI001B83824A|nr:hypothetical protein [Massilia sp. ST3]MBQ5945985.1 hypothetical protein [Massilia sp. ST3]